MVTVWIVKSCNCANTCCQNRGAATQTFEVSVVARSDFIHEVVNAIDEESNKTISILNAQTSPGDEVVYMISRTPLQGWSSFIW
jgi:hypothetical protein